MALTPEIPSSMLPVMEEFYSIQGEGFHTGTASYFVRIGGCDVGCHWCDVKESWNASLHELTKCEDIINRALKYPSRTVIITGGEPCLYNLSELTQQFKKAGFNTHLETSGSETITGEWDWICLSPKKNTPPSKENLMLAHELKVIVYNNDDLKWAETNAEFTNKNCLYFLQPEWSKRNLVTEKIIEFSLQNPKWKLSLQTHKYLGIP